MFDFLYECISIFIIGFIIIHIGYYIHDTYTIHSLNKNKKNNDINKSEDKNDSLTDLKNELDILDLHFDTHEKKDDEIEKKHEKKHDEIEKKNEKKDKKKIKIKKNNSLSSMDELNDIKSSLNNILNDLNEKK